MIEFIESKIAYNVGAVIQDNISNQVYTVISCEKVKDHYNVSIEYKKNYKLNNKIDQLSKVLKEVKLHDKDLFMIENIILELKELIK